MAIKRYWDGILEEVVKIVRMSAQISSDTSPLLIVLATMNGAIAIVLASQIFAASETLNGPDFETYISALVGFFWGFLGCSMLAAAGSVIPALFDTEAKLPRWNASIFTALFGILIFVLGYYLATSGILRGFTASRHFIVALHPGNILDMPHLADDPGD